MEFVCQPACRFHEDFEKGCRALLRIWGIGYQAINPDAN